MVAVSNGKSFLEEPSGKMKASNSMAKPQRTHANHVQSSSAKANHEQSSNAKAPPKDQVSLGTRPNRAQQSKPVKETTFGKESAAPTKSAKETTFGKESAAVTKSLKETSFVNSSAKASSKDPSFESTSGGKRFLDAVTSAGSQLKSTGSQLKSTGW